MHATFISFEKRKMRLLFDRFFPYILLFSFFVAAAVFRPLLPVDETRYMTVAWEMYLNKSYSLLTLNFEPYHHKPPMLFWLINIAWSFFGISRWAGLIPIFVASTTVIVFTQKFTAELFPDNKKLSLMTPWIMAGSLPFLIYSTLVMFDLTLTAIALATVFVFWSHTKRPKWHKILVAAFLISAGVLTKGPVAYLYIFPGLILYPLWKGESETLSYKGHYLSLGTAFILSTLPVVAWLTAALSGASHNFAFWLLWEQTAGRITGNFSAAHIRPFYFYLMLLPLFFLPWILIPSFWKTAKKANLKNTAYKFLFSFTVPAFICFCLISGKQPHYLLPFLPYIVILITGLSAATKLSRIQAVSIFLAFTLVAGQACASGWLFHRFDLASVASFYGQHRDKDWSFAQNYQGRMGFSGKIVRPIEDIKIEETDNWIRKHPDGYMVIRYNPTKVDISRYHVILTRQYQGKMLSIVQGK